jgi:predicted Rossmann-fold nucleotide-binding protein
MPSYRNSNLNKVFAAKEVILSRSEGKKLREKLNQSVKSYEEAIRDEFLYTYFEDFRITIFGSGKVDKRSKDFKFIEKLTKHLSKSMIDVDIVSGGGDGLMLAANLGLENAKKEKHGKIRGKNFGILVDLPNGDEEGNDCLDKTEKFENFSTRLEDFIRVSNGIYLAPGGMGTALEEAMFLQLKQKEKFEHIFPIVAHPFWKPIINYQNDAFYDKRIEEGNQPLIAEKDKNLITYTDSVEEVVKIFKKAHREWMQLKRKVKYVK